MVGINRNVRNNSSKRHPKSIKSTHFASSQWRFAGKKSHKHSRKCLFSTFFTFLQKCKRTGRNFDIWTPKIPKPRNRILCHFSRCKQSRVDYAETCIVGHSHYDRAGHIYILTNLCDPYHHFLLRLRHRHHQHPAQNNHEQNGPFSCTYNTLYRKCKYINKHTYLTLTAYICIYINMRQIWDMSKMFQDTQRNLAQM